MEKLVYLLWHPDATRLTDVVLPALRARVPRGVEAYVRRSPGPGFDAAVTVWLDCHDFRLEVESHLRDVAPRLAGWLVTESRWGEDPAGTMCRLTLVERPRAMALLPWLDGFRHSWRNDGNASGGTHARPGQTVRNLFARALTRGLPHFDALVEERIPEDDADVAFDPATLFDAPRYLSHALSVPMRRVV